MTELIVSLPTRKSARLKGYDYRQSGAYFVTICTDGKARLFGQIRDGLMTQNDLGSIVEHCWREIEIVHSNIALDIFVVMPNHVHGILFILDETKVSSAKREPLDRTLYRVSLGTVVGQFKRAVTVNSKKQSLSIRGTIWQRSYYDHIIRNERSLNDIRKYIIENPAKWQDDSLFVR